MMQAPSSASKSRTRSRVGGRKPAHEEPELVDCSTMATPPGKNERVEGTDMHRQLEAPTSPGEGSVDVDELADSRRRQQEQQQDQSSSSVQTVEERDQLAILRVLEEIDKEEKETKKKAAGASTRPPNRSVAASGRTLPPPQNKGANSLSPTLGVPSTPIRQRQPQSTGAASPATTISKERHTPSHHVASPRCQAPAAPPPVRATAPPSLDLAEAKKKERDAAGEGDDINPALLRHLAGEHRRPGAYHSVPTTPTSPNADVEQQQQQQQQPPLANEPSTSVPGAHNTTTQRSPPPSPHHNPTSLQSATLAPPSLPRHHQSIIEASLVTSQHDRMTTPRRHPIHNQHHHQDDEETATTSQPAMSSRSAALHHHDGNNTNNNSDRSNPNAPAASPNRRINHGDQNQFDHPSSTSINNNNHSSHGDNENVVLVEARDAGIKDFLQNRTFFWFLVGYLLAIFTIAILAGVVIALQRELRQLEIQEEQRSRYTYINGNGEYITDEMQIVLDTAGTLIKEYIDPHYSPSQYEAFDFLQKHTRFQTLSDQQKVQLYALFTFFYSMHYEEWPHPDRDYVVFRFLGDCDLNEKSGFQICNANVGGDHEGGGNGDKNDGVIRRLELAGNGTERHTISNVYGTLPAEVAMLRSLETIHIGFTDLSTDLEDMLPWQLTTLVNLTGLDYGHNRLKSTIPTRIARLDKLTALSLKSNQLTSSIPSQIGTMTHLTSLQLSYNQLIGGIPTQLGNLATDDNGGILKELSLQNNVLLGSLPTQLGTLKELTSLRLQRNGLRETIPTQLGLLTNLEMLQLWGNGMLTGPIPSQIGLMGGLRFLDLNGLALTGTIPTQLGLLTRLERLQLHGNDALTGLIPEGLCTIQGLSHFPVDCLNLDCDPDSCTCSCYGF